MTRKAAKSFILMRDEHVRPLMTKKAGNAGSAAANWHWQLKEDRAGSAIASDFFLDYSNQIESAIQRSLDANAVERWADRALKSSDLVCPGGLG